MCPPIPGLAVLDISIDDSWSDEELVRFLAERKAEDSLPHNVFAGMDFSVFDPQIANAGLIIFVSWTCRGPAYYCTTLAQGTAMTIGDLWYLSWSDDRQPYDCAENGIRKAKNGYWVPVHSSKIPTSTAIMGVKIVLEFYKGQAPCGKRTEWVMHEYQVEQNVEDNLPQDYKSLCTVFLQGDKNLNADSRQNSLNAGNYGLESYLQYLARTEDPKVVAANEPDTSSCNGQHERKTSVPDFFAPHDALATGDYIEMNDLLSSEASAGEQDTSTRKGQHDHKTRSADGIAGHDPLSAGDYIELTDLLNSEASASTSENSSKRSMISEEYFDSDAFLREILKDCNSTDGEHKDSKFSIAAPTELDNVIISPSEQGFVHIHDNNARVTGTSQQKRVPGGNEDLHSSKGIQEHSPSGSSCFPSNHVKRIRSSSSNSAPCSTRSPQRERSTSKFGKIGKYFCFGSF
ncbi:hypothetical protein ACP70R_021442 [Stipagrostis hirtigluma subsp. patula]